MLAPVDVFQKVDDGLNIFVHQQSKSNSDWKKILVFVVNDLLLVLVDIFDWSLPDCGICIVIKNLAMLPII